MTVAVKTVLFNNQHVIMLFFHKFRATVRSLIIFNPRPPLPPQQVYMYQLFRSLAYIHSQGVCHRDIKPQNLLVDPETAILKLCDFGRWVNLCVSAHSCSLSLSFFCILSFFLLSAKQLVRGEPNVSYICSRYYRAPELIFGATDYTSNIDIWSAGCVLAELLLGQPIFPGDSGVDQLVEIIKVGELQKVAQSQPMSGCWTAKWWIRIWDLNHLKSSCKQSLFLTEMIWGPLFLSCPLGSGDTNEGADSGDEP